MPAHDLRPHSCYFCAPYANGPLHLGHLAGAYPPADLYARYQRLKGRDVLYARGSDEVEIILRC